jgi:hypothetical protein
MVEKFTQSWGFIKSWEFIKNTSIWLKKFKRAFSVKPDEHKKCTKTVFFVKKVKRK